MTCFRDRKHTSYNESDNVSMTKALASSSDNSNKIYKHVYTLMLKKDARFIWVNKICSNQLLQHWGTTIVLR